jgi:hypothetical protein
VFRPVPRTVRVTLWVTAGGRVDDDKLASETDPAVLKVLLKVKPGLGEGYDWVECGSCAVGWQVPHFAESVG